MSFEWISRKPQSGTAKLYETKIVLSNGAHTHFDTAYGVMLGLDEKNNRIAVKPVSKGEYHRGIIPEDKRHRITVRSSYARIPTPKFLRNIAPTTALEFSDDFPLSFDAAWDAKKKSLIIDLDSLKEEEK